MFLFWKIRYIDTTDRQFKDRCLFLETETLEPVVRAAVELVAMSDTAKCGREITRFRHLFIEKHTAEGQMMAANARSLRSVGPWRYFEDETGRELTDDEFAQILTRSSTARLIPPGARQHDIDFMLSEVTPIPVTQISLSPHEVRLFAYFARDWRELTASAFLKEGPGRLTMTSVTNFAQSCPEIATAVTDDEIRSFVTIFRRLYMTGVNDPASFTKVVPLFEKVMNGHAYGKWVGGVAREYKALLDSPPDGRPIIPPGTCTFTNKRLIDVFLYTQYAHQPNDQRERQYHECLAEVSGHRTLLTWLFLSTIHHCSAEIRVAGKIISWWFDQYCTEHAVTPEFLNSLQEDLVGIGSLEKEEERQNRLFQEKVDGLALALWKQSGCPVDGPAKFNNEASEQLARMLQSPQ